jgi:carbon storage regulator
MLVLSRKQEEALVIAGGITVRVLEIRGRHVRLGIEAPPEVSIQRREIIVRRETQQKTPAYA